MKVAIHAAFHPRVRRAAACTMPTSPKLARAEPARAQNSLTPKMRKKIAVSHRPSGGFSNQG